MRQAVLIGFRYSGDKKLPGIVTDLYLVYTFLKSQGWSDKEIKIVTDIQEDETTQKLKKAVVERLVNADILSFIEDLKEKDQYFEFKVLNHYNNLHIAFKKSDELFVYYTGHAKEKHLLLPGGGQLSMKQFKNYFSQKTLCVMDCCNGGIDLTFRLIRDVYRTNELFLTEKRIVCIASSTSEQKSITGETGSVFTKRLITGLKDYRKLSQLLFYLNEDANIQTANITSSYPHLYDIFGFMYSKPSLEIILHTNYITIS